jgi:isopentenyl-diphosphate Delta-isomerase
MSRKDEHIKLCLSGMKSSMTTGFENYRLSYNALPEIDFKAIGTSVDFIRRLDYPIIISAMTGGTEQGGKINANLAKAAARFNIAMCVGSVRPLLLDMSLAETYNIRKYAPNILLFANLGAIQLNYGVTARDCIRLVSAIGADGLVLHLNPLQEALQPEGDTNFSSLSSKIKDLIEYVPFPVIVKEVGHGINGEVAARLQSLGVFAIDVAGAGGTSFAKVEAARRGNIHDFADFGLSTRESLIATRQVTSLPVIASGGINNGVDAAKAIALGADLIGIGTHLLEPAMTGPDYVVAALDRLTLEMRISMFSAGAADLKSLRGRIVSGPEPYAHSKESRLIAVKNVQK